SARTVPRVVRRLLACSSSESVVGRRGAASFPSRTSIGKDAGDLHHRGALSVKKTHCAVDAGAKLVKGGLQELPDSVLAHDLRLDRAEIVGRFTAERRKDA